jgi:hypothetical protein
MDARGCQKDRAHSIIQQGADYISLSDSLAHRNLVEALSILHPLDHQPAKRTTQKAIRLHRESVNQPEPARSYVSAERLASALFCQERQGFIMPGHFPTHLRNHLADGFEKTRFVWLRHDPMVREGL